MQHNKWHHLPAASYATSVKTKDSIHDIHENDSIIVQWRKTFTYHSVYHQNIIIIIKLWCLLQRSFIVRKCCIVHALKREHICLLSL
jgi:hypothetical protein